ncbi:MAG: regulatory protein RecX [Pseudomonadota bacterium]
MLARREHASAEVTASLVRKGYDAGIAVAVVAELLDERLLDDTRYADALVRMLAGRGQGPRRVRQALVEAGVPESLISAAMDAGPDWRALAAEVRQRKFGSVLPKTWPQRARQMRFLQYRGFSNDHIGSSLTDMDS